MLELLTCSLITILPDYLLRRRFQGKRWGHEITLFSVWYELRWGITLCAMLTITLFTIVYYFHPLTSNVTSFFRTVTILSDRAGRVEEVFVRNNQQVEAGDPIFRLDASRQEAALETARRQITEIEASLSVAIADRAAATATVAQAEASLRQIADDLDRQSTLLARGSSAVSQRDVDVLENQLGVQEGALAAAQAGVEAIDAQINVLLPARLASAEAALQQAEVEIDELTVFAGTSGTIEQFALQVGDIVNPVLRPAGILVPSGSGERGFQAGFSQMSTQVLKVGGVAEITCMSKPFTVIPMVITSVQDVIASGQLRPSDRLIDLQSMTPPGAVVIRLEPLYEGQTDGIPRGSRCLATAYTNNHARLEQEDLSFGGRIFLHVVDTVGVIHAAGLRLRSILMPLQTLVFTGH